MKRHGSSRQRVLLSRLRCTAALAAGAALVAAQPAAAELTFRHTRLSTGEPGYHSPGMSLRAGDFNGDGHVDLSAYNRSGNLHVFLRDPADGSYAAAPGSPYALPSTGHPESQVGDVDKDGRTDIVVLSSQDSGSTLTVVHGRATGPLQIGTPIAVTNTPHDLALGDVDRDGDLDVVLPALTDFDYGTLEGTAVIETLPGTGTGAFGAAIRSDPIRASVAWAGLVLGDFDRDGIMDAALSGIFQQNNVSVWVKGGLGDGRFGGDIAGTPVWLANAFSIVTSDFNNDGAPDIAAADGANDGAGGISGELRITTALSSPGGSLLPGPFQPTLAESTTLPVYQLGLGDLNGDNVDDLAVPGYNGDSLRPMLSDGAGGFARALPGDLPTVPEGSEALIADLDSDGRPDIVSTKQNFWTGGENTHAIDLFSNTTPRQLAPTAPALTLESAAPGGAPRSTALTLASTAEFGIRIRSVTFDGEGADAFAAEGCTDRYVPGGTTCDVTVSFAPQRSGEHTATLTIVSDSDTNPVRTVAVSGTGTGGDGGGGGDGGSGPGGPGNPGPNNPGPGGPGSGPGGLPSAKKARFTVTVRPKRVAIRRGGRARLAVTVKNVGSARATGVRICPRARARGVRLPRCVRIARLDAGRSARKPLTVRLAKSAKSTRTLRLRLTVSGKNAAKRTVTVPLRVR